MRMHRGFRPGTNVRSLRLRLRSCVLSRTHADYQSARPPGAEEDRDEDQEPRAPGQPAEARCMRARVHADAEEAEFRAAQGRARALDQRHRSHDLHPRRGTQPAGALAGAHSRRPREGSAGRALSRRARNPRRRRRAGPETGTLEVRSEETEAVMRLTIDDGRLTDSSINSSIAPCLLYTSPS